jgi:hypothetical protein
MPTFTAINVLRRFLGDDHVVARLPAAVLAATGV